MRIEKNPIDARGIKLVVHDGGVEVGRVYLYVLHNSLHEVPFGYMEDLFVDESYRGKGIGKQLISAVVAEAKMQGCYKLIGTTRHSKPDVQEMYVRYGFENWGMEFRMDLDT